MESFASFAERTTSFQTDSVPGEPTFGLPTSLAHKVAHGSGALLPFHGNTVAYFLDDATCALVDRLTRQLQARHGESLAEPLPVKMAHVTLCDLDAGPDPSHVRPLVAASTLQAWDLVAGVRDLGPIHVECSAVFNLMNTSVAIGVRAVSEAEHLKLMIARAAFDEITHRSTFTPHITLAYYRPSASVPIAPAELRTTLRELTQRCTGIEFALDPARLHVLHFDSMARYWEPAE